MPFVSTGLDNVDEHDDFSIICSLSKLSIRTGIMFLESVCTEDTMGAKTLTTPTRDVQIKKKCGDCIRHNLPIGRVWKKVCGKSIDLRV